ncbi:hypothetical protein pb186bvf_000702 [Paramecium bursaria]
MIKQEDIDEKFNSIKASQENSFKLITGVIQKLKKKLQHYKGECQKRNINTENVTQESEALDGYVEIQIKSLLGKFSNTKQQIEYQLPPNNLPPKQQETKEVTSFKCKLCKNAYDAPARLYQHIRFRHPEEAKKFKGV